MFFKLKPSHAMKFDSRFRVVHLRWWHRPIPLYDKKEGDEHYRKVGWIYNKKAYVVDNLFEGWVAFVKDQTPEKIDVWWCKCCGAALDGSTRERIEKALKEKS